MELRDHHQPRALPCATIIGTASAAFIILHASHVGPFADDALRLAIITMSGAAGVECAIGHRRSGLALSVFTVLIYWLFLYPLELLPQHPVFFSAFYIATCAGSLAIAPVMLLRRHFGLAAAGLIAGVVMFLYILP
ncbi:MAG: hypothetical protein M5U20_05755 [Phycisphaerales bacterium]|nr:hypothetical protein [Phycisphaerales bacterium]